MAVFRQDNLNLYSLLARLGMDSMWNDTGMLWERTRPDIRASNQLQN